MSSTCTRYSSGISRTRGCRSSLVSSFRMILGIPPIRFTFGFSSVLAVQKPKAQEVLNHALIPVHVGGGAPRSKESAKALPIDLA